MESNTFINIIVKSNVFPFNFKIQNILKYVFHDIVYDGFSLLPASTNEYF